MTIVHVGNKKYARQALWRIRARFEECKLELHPKSTKLVYCNKKGRNKKRMVKHKEFDFLGYTFRTRTIQTKDGSLIKGFSPAISRKSMKKIVKECFRLTFHRWTHIDIHQLSQVLAPKIRGWIYYYGRLIKSSLDKVFKVLNWRLSKWANNKYKRFKRRKALWYAKKWMREIATDFGYIFSHWQHGFTHKA